MALNQFITLSIKLNEALGFYQKYFRKKTFYTKCYFMKKSEDYVSTI